MRVICFAQLASGYTPLTHGIKEGKQSQVYIKIEDRTNLLGWGEVDS